MSTVAAPSDRRFRRAHVKPARKRRSWGRRAGFLATSGVSALVVAYGAYRGAALLTQARVLQIDRIAVHGNERLIGPHNSDVVLNKHRSRGGAIAFP